jgi:hypothetical protein
VQLICFQLVRRHGRCEGLRWEAKHRALIDCHLHHCAIFFIALFPEIRVMLGQLIVPRSHQCGAIWWG